MSLKHGTPFLVRAFQYVEANNRFSHFLAFQNPHVKLHDNVLKFTCEI